MKEKCGLFENCQIEFQKNRTECKHEWEEPIYDPDLFDGIERWVFTCKLCGKKVTSFADNIVKSKTLKK